MKWVKYLQRTPMAQIRADWAEYMNLRRQCTAARDARRAAYGRIVTIENGEKQGPAIQSCICQYYYTGYPFRNNNGDSLNDNMVWVRYSNCNKFDDDMTKCAKMDCPFVRSNHEYVDACARLKVMRQARHDFWGYKFAQACQNVK